MSAISQSPADPHTSSRREWTLLSNHGHVLVCLARDPEMRMRDIAQSVGITERACYRIVGDLEQAGLVRRERVGRNNRYTIDRTASMRHPLWRGMRAAQLLAID
ncbi:MAG: helix-turn-helix transcriptional regulator [Candidatus Dormibacteria bacterium]